MTEKNVAIQANFKTKEGSLFNIYGVTADEFEFNLKAFGALLDDILATEARVGNSRPSAVATVQAAVGGTVINDPSVAAPPVVASSGAPACKHGPMEWKEGTSKAGKAYKLWSCTSKNRQDQCDPVWPK